MLSQPGLMNFTAFEDLCKWLLMDDQYTSRAGCSILQLATSPRQKFGEVYAPEHTKGKLIIPHSSARTAGKLLSSVPPAQPVTTFQEK